HGMPPLRPGALDDIAVDSQGHAWLSNRKPFVTWIGHVTEASNPDEVPALSTERVSVPLPRPGAEAFGARDLWVLAALPGPTGESVSLIDVRHRRVASMIPLGRQTTAIAYGDGAAWIGTYDPQDSTAWVSGVRPGSERVESLELETGDGAGPLSVA